MKRPNKSCGAEILGRIEDRAIQYLRDLSPATAFATALEAEHFVATRWAAKQTKVLQSGDSRNIFRIEDADVQMMRQARSMVPPDGMVNFEALHLILRTLGDLPLDQKWKVTLAIVLRATGRYLLSDDLAPGTAESTLTGLKL